MSLPIYQVDAFTQKPFSGNPAGVCILPATASEQWMQLVAREMNLSETAFLVRQDDGYQLRWFTPAVEVDLCGHATLASAHVLFETGQLSQNEQARFHTRSGLLTATWDGSWIELDFPIKPVDAPLDAAEVKTALGVEPIFVGKSQFDYLIEVGSEAEVRSTRPDFTLLKSLPARGFIITCRSNSTEFDFVSRFFAPAVGVDEDPVTGSAHCVLAPYWAGKLGKTDMVAFQASERGGVIRIKLFGDRVCLAGQAVTIFTGNWCVDPE